MGSATVKDLARQIVDRLPDGASWDDLQYEIYVRQVIEAGLADSNADLVEPVEDVRRSFGLAP